MTAADLIGIGSAVIFVGLPGLIIMYAVANACCDELEDRAKEKRS